MSNKIGISTGKGFMEAVPTAENATNAQHATNAANATNAVNAASVNGLVLKRNAAYDRIEETSGDKVIIPTAERLFIGGAPLSKDQETLVYTYNGGSNVIGKTFEVHTSEGVIFKFRVGTYWREDVIDEGNPYFEYTAVLGNLSYKHQTVYVTLKDRRLRLRIYESAPQEFRFMYTADDPDNYGDYLPAISAIYLIHE